MSWISSVASAFHDPPVSIATGMKMWVLVMLVYFVFLAMAALSPALPAWREVLPRWNCAYASRIVTSQVIDLLRAQCINVDPSERLASTRDIPTGSLEAGTWAFCIALNIMPLSMALKMWFGPLFLHLRSCRPRASTLVPHTHAWGWHVLDPTRCLNATLMASSDNRRPKEYSQSPAWAAPGSF